MKRKMWWLKRSSSPHLFARYLMLFCALGVIFLPTSYVWANPAGEQVVGGAATFQRDGNKLTVNQATDRLAVNWQSFNIGAGESTHFNMPSSTSAALNRVIGGNPSSIYGSLSANGILYLINPSGILVGPGGTVNAASFMASTLDVSTEQFMNGKGPTGMRFNGPSGESIVNQGNITAEKGDVFLVAQKVENRGTINAANGTAGMVGSGQATDVMVHEVGGTGFAIRVAQLQGEAATGSNRDLPDGEELLNEGSISAAQAELNASGNVYALAIRNSGTIRAKAVVANADGTVRLDGGLGDVINTGRMYAKNAGDDATAAGGKIEVMGQNITASPESIITAAGGEQGGNGGSVKIDSQDTTIVQGKVDVAAPSAGAKGGKVQLLGERVGLFDGAKVDASGGAGGGTVLAGGDYLGGRTPTADLKNLAKQEAEPVKNAKATVMADTAEIKADATVSGDGGKIILWSDEYTGFYGDLFARGGAEGGNGGFIETSSKNNLQASGSANASASLGKAGLWLLDPQNVSIITGGTGTLTAGVFDPSTPDATIAPATIVAALDGGTSVTITTGSTGTQAGNITVANSVTTAGNTNTDLTLAAANNIVLNAGAVINLSSNAGGADISLLADFDGSGSGTITTSAAITAGTTGTVTLQGSGTIGTGAVVTAQNVVFQGALAGSSIGVNDATGLVQISSAALTTNLAATGTVTIGRTDGTGTISIGSGGTLNLAGEGYNLALLGTSSSAVFNFTGANTLTLKAGGVLTLNLGTGNLFSPGNTTTDFTSTTGGMVLTSAGQIGSADSSAPFLTSMANLSGTTTGSINITDAGGLTVNGALSSGNANINLNAGTGGAFANTGGTISAGAGVITITANTINIANTVTGNGGINLVPDAAATTVAINDATGTFSISSAELAFLASTGVVSIGSAASSSAFNIGSIGSIDLSAETYDLTILKTSGATTFNFTAGNTLTLQNNGILSFNVGSGTIQGSSLNTTDITIGGNGTISFNSGAVGTTQRLKTSVANYGTSLTSANVFLSSTRAGGVNFGGTFSLGPIGSFDLSLNSAGAVTQDQAILASGLELLGSGSVTLNNVANNIVTLAGNTTGTGFSYTDSNAFAVGTVNTTTGLTTTSGNTILQALTGLLNVTSALSVSGGNATLQTSAGAITTAAAITSTGGTVTLQSAGGDLTVGGVVSAVDRNINLTTSGNLAVNSGVNAAQGTATLTATTIALSASVIGNGGINLIPAAGTAVGIGSAPTSTFGLSTTEMNFLVSTGTVTFGSSGTRVGAIGLAEGGSISLATNSYNLAFYGSGDVTFGGTLTMGNNRGLTLDVGTGRIISAASGVDLAIGGNGTLGITSSGAVGQTANGPLSTQIANLAGAIVSGAFSMDNNNVNLLVNGAVNAAANSVTLTTGTGNLSNTSAINSTGTVTLTTDSQDIQATIGGTGATIVLAQQTTGRAIQLGTDGPLYSLTSTELGFLQGNTARIGATTSSGITITAPILMPNVTNLNLTSSGISDSGGVSGISVTGLALTSNGLISLTGSGNSFSTVAALLSGSAVSGASITLNDAVSMAIGTVDTVTGLNNSAAGNGTISLTSGGSITQTAAMTTGTGTITAATTTAGNDILLSTQANNLSSSLFTLGGTQANVRNFGLRNTSASALAPVVTGATALNNVTLTYNAAPLAVPGMDITGNLSVTSGGAMTQSGNILVDGSTTLAAGANTINLSTFAGNDFSSLLALSATGSTISLKDQNGFLLGTTTASGNLTLNAGGAVTQSGAISAVGLELLGLGSYTLTNTGNDITTLAGNTGAVSFLDQTGATPFSIGTVNTVGLTTTGNTTLSTGTAAGTVTQTQKIQASGLELLGDGTYTLSNTSNDIATLAGNLTTGSLNYTDSNGFAVGQVNTTKGITTTSGSVNLTAGAAGNLSVQQAILSGAASTLTAGGEFSSVTSPSGLGTVEVTAGSLTITSATINLASNIKADGGTILKPSTAGQTIGLNSVTGGFDLSTSELLNLISTGTVTIGRSVDGTGTYTVGGVGAFDISATSYDLTLEGLTSAIAFSNGMTLGNGRTLNLAAGGAITSGATGTDITIGDGFNSGTLFISSVTTVGISGNALSTAIDQLGASTVGTTFLSNSRALQTTGAIGVTGNLALTTGGTLSQSGTGAVTVSGTTAFTVPTGSDVLMADAANNLGALTLTASGGTTFRDLELRNVSASASVPTVNATRNVVFNFDNAGVTLPSLTLTGTLDVTAGDGAITQTGILNIIGNSSFASTGFGITLGNALNVFGSNVSLATTALQNATLVDSTALVLGTSDLSALLNLTSGGSITQATGTTLTTGAGITTSFTTAASDLLLTGANSISGQVAFGGTLANIRDVSIQNSSTGAQVPVLEGLTNLRDLTLNYSGVGAFEVPSLQGFASLRNISFSTAGPMTQKSGGISNLGTAAFTIAGLNNAITLDDAANNFGLAVSLITNDGDQTLRESSGLVVGTMNAGTGELTINVTAGATTQTGVITSGGLNFTSAGSVNLNQANVIQGSIVAIVTGAGNGFTLTNDGITDEASTLTLAGITTGVNAPISVFTGGNMVIAENVTNSDGAISLKASGDLALAVGKTVGSGTTTGNIILFADQNGSGEGDLSINGTVGNATSTGSIELAGVDFDLNDTTGFVQTGSGVVNIHPSVSGKAITLGGLAPGTGFVINELEFARISTAGVIKIGSSSQNGSINIESLNLSRSSFGALQLSGGALAEAILAADTTWTTPGLDLIFDINVGVREFNWTMDTTSNGQIPTGGDITFVKQVDCDRTLEPDVYGGGLTLTAGMGDVLFTRSVGSINPLAFLIVNSAGDLTTGRINLRQAGTFGAGGLLSLTADKIITTGNLIANGVTGAPGIGVVGGQISITGRDVTLNSTISTNGGNGVQSDTGTDYAGGSAGDIFIRSTGSITIAPQLENTEVGGSFSALGGNPSNAALAFGADGVVDLQSATDIFFKASQLAQREMQYLISAGRNLVFAAVPDFENVKDSVGAVSFSTNVNNDEVSKQPLTLNFNSGVDSIGNGGVIFMATGSSIQTNGGQLNIVGGGNGITLADINVIDSPSFNLSYNGTADLLISGSVFGQNSSDTRASAASGAVISISAPTSNLTIERGVTVQGNDFFGTGGGYAILEGKNVTVSTINASGGDDGISTSSPGRGGEIKIKANYDGTADSGKIIVTSLLARGGQSSDTFYGGQGGDGGRIVLDVGNGLDVKYMNVEGGSSSDFGSLGGQGGRITITSGRDLLIPAGLFAGGGSGTVVNGAAGTVTITTNVANGDIAMSSGTITLSGNANLNISSAGSVTLGVVSGYTIGNPFIDPFKISSGSNLTINSGSVVGDNLGDLTILYGTVDVGARFYMPGSNTIRTTGGDISILRDSDLAPGGGLLGQAFVGGIVTTLSNGDAGSVVINANQGGLAATGAEVIINGNINTSGGDAVAATTFTPAGLLGFNAGSVEITGDTVSVRRINSLGGNSDVTSGNDSSGGQGGGITLTATGVAPTITLQRNLTALGGTGLGTGDASGGGGGSIQLNGNVVLSSGNSSTPMITLSSAGGAGKAGGESGIGGAIVATGSITGTTSTSNTLQLTHGSGPVILGATPADTITLLELITADPAGVATDSTGSVVINGSLDLTTLTTQGFGYSLSILGGGTIANRVTFLNTGTTRIGAAGVTTTFTDGFDALNGTTTPSTLQLGGTINTVTATTGSMLANTTVLVADTTLNSAGNIIQFGSLDGLFDLTLAAGVAGGSTTFSGAVGDTEQLGQITVASGVTGLVNFASTVQAVGIQSAATSQLTFNNDVTLSGTGAVTSLGGTLTLNNQAYLDGDLDARLSFLGAGSNTISGATTFTGGPIEFGGAGTYIVTGTMNGAQNLILSGLGTKTFTGILGGTTALGTGTGAAILMSGGNVAFGKLTTASGIVSSANVALTDTTTLAAGNTDSSLTGDVDLLGATLTSAGTVGLGDSAADSVKLDGAVLVNGTGTVNVGGTVTDNASFTSFTQAGTAGNISFDENVTLDVVAGLVTLNGNVGLSGMSFSTAGTVTLGNALTDSITLTTAAVTLTGTGTFAVNGVVVGGSQNLTLSGAGGKTFAGGMSDLGTLGVTAGTGTFNKTLSGVAFNQSGGVAVLNGNGTFTGASTLGGTSTTLNGIIFSSGTTAVTGGLTSTGATTITGGLITLNTASALTSGSGVLTMGSAVSLGQGATLGGAGAYKLSGTVNGANSLTLNGAGAKTFSGAVGTGTALTTITQANDSGLVTFAEDVTMSGAGAFNANLVLDGLTMTSTGSALTFGSTGTDTAVISGATTFRTTGQNITLNSATTLNAALTMSDVGAVGGITTLSGAVTGKSSDLTVTTDNLVVGNTVQTGSGVVSLVKKDGLALAVGGVAPGFLDATEISRISTSGGLTVATGGDITINELVLGDTDQITGAFRMVTTGGDIDVAQSVQLNVFSGSAIAGALTATGSTLSTRLATRGFQDVVLGVGGLSYDGASSMNLSRIQVAGDILVSSADAMTVNGSVTSGTGDVALESLNSNLNVLGTVTSAGSMGLIASRDIRIASLVTAPDAVFVDAGGYFINSYSGNPFQSADTRVATTDIFGSNWPSNGAVPGLQVVYGVSDAALVQANQIGVSTTLLAGNGAPYVLQFTTGTGQPYIFAQQAAIPPVMLPAALTGGSGFTKAVSYSADEIEMMTPEERSAYENQQRQVSARVILQGESGEGEEIGAPTEGRTPQAAIPAVQIPLAPTAQVLLEGKPLAGAKSDQERGDAKRILKVRPTRAVALRSGLNVNEVIESERMAAEVSVGSAPVVQNR